MRDDSEKHLKYLIQLLKNGNKKNLLMNQLVIHTIFH